MRQSDDRITALYQKYAPEVFRFALYLSGNEADAEDITSETFVRAWTSPSPIEVKTVKGYLFTIARNLFLQSLRKSSKHESLSSELRDSQASPEMHAEHKAELSAVLLRLQKLPEVDRAALLLRTFEELPYDEIARVLGISIASAKVKVHRARLLLTSVRTSS